AHGDGRRPWPRPRRERDRDRARSAGTLAPGCHLGAERGARDGLQRPGRAPGRADRRARRRRGGVTARMMLATPPRVISLGLDLFAHALERLGVPVVHLAWSPPANADPQMVELLDRLQARAAGIEAANAEVLSRLVDGDPVLIDCRPAWEALELPERTVL